MLLDHRDTFNDGSAAALFRGGRLNTRGALLKLAMEQQVLGDDLIWQFGEDSVTADFVLGRQASAEQQALVQPAEVAQPGGSTDMMTN